MNEEWLIGVVLKGDQQGRRIGFPTANFSPLIMPSHYKQGIYASFVKRNNQLYKGALFYGPRRINNENTPVLEIHILDFDQTIYDETISFSIQNFIRPVQSFSSIQELQEAIKQDVQQTHLLLTNIK